MTTTGKRGSAGNGKGGERGAAIGKAEYPRKTQIIRKNKKKT